MHETDLFKSLYLQNNIDLFYNIKPNYRNYSVGILNTNCFIVAELQPLSAEVLHALLHATAWSVLFAGLVVKQSAVCGKQQHVGIAGSLYL